MKKYKVLISFEFPILAENELEAIDIANQQVKQIKRDYLFDLKIRVVE